MNISYSYRGKTTVIEDDFNQPRLSINGSVTFEGYCFSDGNKKIFKATIEAYELLITAQRCLEQLNSFAGTDYIVVNNK